MGVKVSFSPAMTSVGTATEGRWSVESLWAAEPISLKKRAGSTSARSFEVPGDMSSRRRAFSVLYLEGEPSRGRARQGEAVEREAEAGRPGKRGETAAAAQGEGRGGEAAGLVDGVEEPARASRRRHLSRSPGPGRRRWASSATCTPMGAARPPPPPAPRRRRRHTGETGRHASRPARPWGRVHRGLVGPRPGQFQGLPGGGGPATGPRTPSDQNRRQSSTTVGQQQRRPAGAARLQWRRYRPGPP